MTTTLDAAREYIRQGYSPLPIPHQQKSPKLKAWQDLRLTENDLAKHFNGKAQNIGLLLGGASRGLADVDLDSPEARLLAPDILPTTEMVWGRESSPSSHYGYILTSEAQYLKLTGPQSQDSQRTTIVELRYPGSDKGFQTLVPPSTHPSGEAVRWYREAEPAPVDGEELERAVKKLGAAVILLRAYPAPGSRHDFVMALAGGLCRGGIAEDEAVSFVTSIANAAGDEEVDERGQDVMDTYARLRRSEPATGWPVLAGLIDEKVLRKVREWLGVPGPDDDHDHPKKRSDELIRAALDGSQLWHTPKRDAYATITEAGHREHWPIDSGTFKEWLSREVYRSRGQVINSAPLGDAIRTLIGKAKYDGPEHSIHTRLAERDGSIWLDLANERWQAVEITADGWSIKDDVPVKFHRSNGTRALPMPVPGGSLDELWRFANVKPADRVLVLAWLVAALRPHGPYPVLDLVGGHGSAKTTTARVLQRCVDPGEAEMRAIPREERDLAIAAKNSYIVGFDNLSGIPQWLSDALCRVATGGGFATRKLHTDDEEALFDYQRPVLGTGIEPFATRPDLLDRCLLIELPEIGETARRTEREFWREFEKVRPRILGVLLDAVSMALQNVDTVRLARVPRMADFAEWAVAAEPALGVGGGSFMAAYTTNRAETSSVALESSPIFEPLRELLEAENPWTGTSSELLDSLSEQASVTSSITSSPAWPRTARALSAHLNRIEPNLKAEGIRVRRGQREGAGSRRIIVVERSSTVEGGG